jgi:uncharacterized repeat protein (TIGR01451 family)
MSYRIASIATLVVACSVSTTLAQSQPASQTRNTPSLIQRFEKFRDSLIGSPEQQVPPYDQQRGPRAGSTLNGQRPTSDSPRTARRTETSSNRPTSLQPIPADQREPSQQLPRATLRRPVSSTPSFNRPSSQKSRSSQQSRSSASSTTDQAAAESSRLAGGSKYRPSTNSQRKTSSQQKTGSQQTTSPSSTRASANTSERVASRTNGARKNSPTLADPLPKTRLRHTAVESPGEIAVAVSQPERTRGLSNNPYVNTESVRTARAETRKPTAKKQTSKTAPSRTTPSRTASSRRAPVADLARSINESSKTSGVARGVAAKSVATKSDAATNVAATSVAATKRAKSTKKTSTDDELLFTRHTPVLIVETAGPRQINVGRTAIYKVRVRNEGRSEVENTVVSFDVPAWAEIVGVEATTGETRLPTSAADTGISWSIDRVDSGSDELMTLRLVPRESRTFDLAVRYTVSPPASQMLVEVQEPKLSMAMSGPSEVFYGEEIVYKLTVSNPGSGDADNVVVRLLPAADSDAATAQHTLGSIPAGESRVMELELNARQAGKMLIHAESSADGGLMASVRENVLVRRADLDVEMTGPGFQYAGTEAAYKVRVINPGNATAQDVEVTTMLPPGAKYVTSSGGGRFDSKNSTVTWKLNSLQPGAEHVFDLTCQPGMAGVNRHEVVVTASDGLRDATMLATEVEALADLELNVKDPKGPVPVTQRTKYEIVIHNRGAEAATDVEVVAYFSSGVEPLTAEGVSHEIMPGQVVFDVIPTIGAGQEISMTISAEANQAGNHSFRVELRCDSLDTRLAAEETTRFFGDTRSLSGEPTTTGGVSDTQQTPLRPIPVADNHEDAGHEDDDFEDNDFEDTDFEDNDVTPAEHLDGE